jgi:hypothetical protein
MDGRIAHTDIVLTPNMQQQLLWRQCGGVRDGSFVIVGAGGVRGGGGGAAMAMPVGSSVNPCIIHFQSIHQFTHVLMFRSLIHSLITSFTHSIRSFGVFLNPHSLINKFNLFNSFTRPFIHSFMRCFIFSTTSQAYLSTVASELGASGVPMALFNMGRNESQVHETVFFRVVCLLACSSRFVMFVSSSAVSSSKARGCERAGAPVGSAARQ